MQWRSRGTAAASADKGGCEVLVLSSADFEDAIQKHVRLHALVAEFGASLCEFLAGEADLTELSISTETYTRVVQGVALDLRQLVSHAALAQQHGSGLSFLSFQSHNERLREEVDSGKCFVVELAPGELRRVLRVVAVQLLRSDGRVLVEMRSPCQFPGVHIKESESSAQARERVLEAVRLALAAPPTFGATWRELARRRSRKYGLPTEYVVEVHSATVAASVEEAAASEAADGDAATSLPAVELFELDLNGPKTFAWLTQQQWLFTQEPAGEAAVAQLLQARRRRSNASRRGSQPS